MLIEFSVGNYRSFKEVVTFSMVAANLVSQDKQIDASNTFAVDEELRLLKSAAIYGANASGKSNLVKAMVFMRQFVINSSRETQSTDKIDIEPFRLSTETELEPSFFEIIFRTEEIQYRYGFKLNANEVLSEWLFYVPKARETNLFERRGDKFEIKNKMDADGIQKRTRNNALFLSVCAQFNVEIAKKILNWFNHNLSIISGLTDQKLRTIFYLLSDSNRKTKVIEVIRKLDVGFRDLKFEEKPLSDDLLPKELSEAFNTYLSIQTFHHKFDGSGNLVSTELFDLKKQESEGTQKIFALAGPLVDTLENEITLIIDEFDARLHPLISREILKLFNSSETNPRNAQLVVITHDTNLLSNKLFRRDQIWFTEKNQYEATDLYSLAEYKVRNDASFAKDYIKGRYGGIPYIGDIVDFSLLIDSSSPSEADADA